MQAVAVVDAVLDLGQVSVPAHQDGGQADEGVQQGDQFWHARHLDAHGHEDADDGADAHGHQDGDHHPGGTGLGDREVDPLDLGGLAQHRRQDDEDQGQAHADHAEQVAPLGGLMLAQTGQGQDEAQTRQNIRTSDE